MSFPHIFLGAGGHARVLLEVLKRQGASVLGFTDIVEPSYLPEGVAWLGGDEEVFKLDPERVHLVNGLGSSHDVGPRRLIYERFTTKGYRFASVIHPDAILSTQYLQIGEGVQIMAGAVINPHCRIGDNVLVNTRAVIEHDCGAKLCKRCLDDYNKRYGKLYDDAQHDVVCPKCGEPVVMPKKRKGKKKDGDYIRL